MKEISVILKEMENSLAEIRNSFDHREMVSYLEKYKASYSNDPKKADSSYAGITRVKFNLIYSSMMFKYQKGIRDISEGHGKKSDRKMQTEIKNIMDLLLDYTKKNMPEWYELAEKGGMVKDIRAKTQKFMESI